MKILFISNLFPDRAEPYRGLDNACLLHALAAGGDEIRVISPRPTLPFRRVARVCREVDEKFRPIYVPARYVPKLGSYFNHHLMARALRSVLRASDFRPDIVLSSWIFPDSCAVGALATEFGFRFVAIAQGSDVHQYLRMPARRAVIVPALNRAQGTVTRSGELARLLADAGVEKQNLHTVYNGVDTSLFHPADRAIARKELGLPETGRVILYVGNFYEIKNPLLLVRAHKRLLNTSLVMLGGGPLEKQARSEGGSSLILAGRKTPEQVARYMQAADLLCVPSHNEGVPNVILEALASGLPVVASRVGGIPEIIREPHLGQLVPMNDEDALTAALETQLAAPDATAQICAFAEQFTWPKTAAAYRRILSA